MASINEGLAHLDQLVRNRESAAGVEALLPLVLRTLVSVRLTVNDVSVAVNKLADLFNSRRVVHLVEPVQELEWLDSHSPLKRIRSRRSDQQR